MFPEPTSANPNISCVSTDRHLDSGFDRLLVKSDIPEAVPHGKLIFFPSHEQLADAVNHWQRLALLQRGAAGGFDRLGGIPVVIAAGPPEGSTVRKMWYPDTTNGTAIYAEKRPGVALGVGIYGIHGVSGIYRKNDLLRRVWAD